MSNESYTVPTLSLSNSRSRKNIPTKDVYQSRGYVNTQSPSFGIGSNVSINSNVYMQKKDDQLPYVNQNTSYGYSKNYANSFLPPKPKTLESKPVTYPLKNQQKQISRNVYLSSQQQSTSNYTNNYTQQQSNQSNATNRAIQSARQILNHSNSRGSLLRNPQSRVQIQNQVRKQTNNMEFKKIDINKALFDRKMTKLFQEIQFYEQQLNSLYTDSLIDQIQQLENIKEENKTVHSKILRDLNALIA